jgi:hypothetical protein
MSIIGKYIAEEYNMAPRYGVRVGDEAIHRTLPTGTTMWKCKKAVADPVADLARPPFLVSSSAGLTVEWTGRPTPLDTRTWPGAHCVISHAVARAGYRDKSFFCLDRRFLKEQRNH